MGIGRTVEDIYEEGIYCEDCPHSGSITQRHDYGGGSGNAKETLATCNVKNDEDCPGIQADENEE